MPSKPVLEPVNTPITLGVTPRYVLMQNAISRSIYNLSATAQKLTAMAMALLPLDLSSLTAAFTYTEFCNALGLPKGGESFKMFRSAVKECMKNTISIEMTSQKTGKKTWIEYTWFTMSMFSEETGLCTMEFSPKLARILEDFKRLYTKIPLSALGRLQSKYALRIYEIAMSYSSLAGKQGNNAREWYFERSVPDLRRILCVSDASYAETKHFRQFVIENPLKELNKAGIGIEITTESVKHGRNLIAIRFICRFVPKSLPVTKRGGQKTKTAPLALPEPGAKTARDREEKELEHLRELYPEEFTALYVEELAKNKRLQISDKFKQLAASGAAAKKLRKKYGIVQ